MRSLGESTPAGINREKLKAEGSAGEKEKRERSEDAAKPGPKAKRDMDTQATDVWDIPNWSSFDLGRSLAALRTGTKTVRIRTLQRLHTRWWHASEKRMADLLRAAGVPDGTIALLPAVVKSCRICRLWERPGRRPATSSRLTERFNDVVQFDLLFIEGQPVIHVIDEATRFTWLELVADQEEQTILDTLSDTWVKLFGAPKLIITDKEGALDGDRGLTWCERLGIERREKPKGVHAQLVERHHQMARDLVHKVKSQLTLEGLEVPLKIIIGEAMFAKNVLLNVHGESPYRAVFGRTPPMLREFEDSTISNLQDFEGAPRGGARHAARVREIALQQMIEGTAQAKMKHALETNARMPGQVLELQPGDLVDIYRKPTGEHAKDLTGWKGPCKVTDVTNIEDGTIGVKWRGKVMSISVPDVRKHLALLALWLSFQQGSPAMQSLQCRVEGMKPGTTGLYGHAYGQKGWQLSKGAKEDPDAYSTILQVANELNVPSCIGGRIGKGIRQLNGLLQTGLTHVLTWESDGKEEMCHFEIEGQLHIDFTRLVGERWRDTNFVQFITMEEQVLEHIAEQNQDFQNEHREPPNPGAVNDQGAANAEGQNADFDIRSAGSRDTALPHPSDREESWATDSYEGLPPEQGVTRPRSTESLGSLGPQISAARTDDHPGLRPNASPPPEDYQSVISQDAEDEDEAQLTFWASIEGRTTAPAHWQDQLTESEKCSYNMTTSDAETTAGESSDSDTPECETSDDEDDIIEVQYTYHASRHIATTSPGRYHAVETMKLRTTEHVLVFSVNPKTGKESYAIEREMHVLTEQEMIKHAAECEKAALKELQKWEELQAIAPIPRC